MSAHLDCWPVVRHTLTDQLHVCQMPPTLMQLSTPTCVSGFTILVCRAPGLLHCCICVSPTKSLLLLDSVSARSFGSSCASLAKTFLASCRLTLKKVDDCPLANPLTQPLGLLVVRLLAASNAPRSDWFSKSDCFVRCAFVLPASQALLVGSGADALQSCF